jgi:toxin ParE1/3/4
VKIRFKRSARAEASRARNYYRDIDPALGTDFVAAVDGAVSRAAQRPLLFPEIQGSDVEGARRVLLHGFPYALVFCVAGDTLEILAVMHQAQEPGYWRKR